MKLNLAELLKETVRKYFVQETVWNLYYHQRLHEIRKQYTVQWEWQNLWYSVHYAIQYSEWYNVWYSTGTVYAAVYNTVYGTVLVQQGMIFCTGVVQSMVQCTVGDSVYTIHECWGI